MSGIPNKMLPVAVEMLPEGYRRLEYLEGTGTQWMLFYFPASIEATAKIDLQFIDAPKRGLMGFNSSSLYFGVNPNNAYYWEPYTAGMPDYLSRTNVVLYGSEDDVDNYVEIGGIKVARRNSISGKLNQIALFSLAGGAAGVNCRIYSCSVVNETGLVCNLIPCLDDKNKPCMFDTVSRKPLYNKGTGEFLYRLPGDGELPAGYTRLEYLESTGTQWIDTGIKLSSESEARCEFMRLSVTDTTMNLYGDETDKNSRFSCFFNVGASNYSRWDFAEQMVTGTPLEILTKYKSVHNATGVSLNGLQIVNFASAEPFEAGGGLKLFGLRQAYIPQARVYSFSISRDDQLQLNFIPCLDDKGVPCMFDTVTRRPFRNAATTGPDFLYG